MDGAQGADEDHDGILERNVGSHRDYSSAPAAASDDRARLPRYFLNTGRLGAPVETFQTEPGRRRCRGPPRHTERRSRPTSPEDAPSDERGDRLGGSARARAWRAALYPRPNVPEKLSGAGLGSIGLDSSAPSHYSRSRMAGSRHAYLDLVTARAPEPVRAWLERRLESLGESDFALAYSGAGRRLGSSPI